MRFIRWVFFLLVTLSSCMIFGQKKDADTLKLSPPPAEEIHSEWIPELNFLSNPNLSIPLEYSAMPTYSNLPVLSYDVPMPSYSNGVSGAQVVNSVQMGCGISYRPNYKHYQFKKYVHKDGLLGIRNNKDTILKPVYSSIMPIYAGSANHYVVQQNTHFSIVDSTGNSLDGNTYDAILTVSKEQYRCIHHQATFLFKKDGLYGLKKDTGDWILPMVFDTIEPFYMHWHCPEKFAFYVAKNIEGTFVYHNFSGKYLENAFDSIKSIVRIEINASSISMGETFHIIKGYIKGKLHVFKNKNLLLVSDFSDVEPLYDHNWSQLESYVFEKDNKRGVYSKGRVIIPADYDKIERQQNGYKVYKDGRVGLYNLQGNLMLHPEYEKFSLLKDGYYFVRKNGKSYFLNAEKETVFSEGFDEAWNMNSLVWRIKKGGNYGYVKPFQAKFLLEPIYDANSYFMYSNWDNDYSKLGVIHTIRKGKYGLVDTTGKVLFENLFDKQIKILEYGKERIYILQKANEQCLQFENGEVLNINKDDYLDPKGISRGYALVKTNDHYRVYSLDHKRYFGKTFERIIRFKTSNEDRNFRFAGILNNQLNIYQNDSLLAAIDVDFVSSLQKNNTLYIYKDYEKAIVDYSGAFLEPFSLQVLEQLNNSNRLIRTHQGIVILDASNQEKGEIWNYYYTTKDSLIIAKVKHNGKFGVYDWSGNNIIPPNYTKIKVYDDILALKDRYYALANKCGKLLTEAKYHKVKYQYGNAVCVRNNRYFGIVDTNGNELYPYKLRYKLDLKELSNRSYKIVSTSNGKVILNASFKEVVPEEGKGYYQIIKSKTNAYFFIHSDYEINSCKIYDSKGNHLFSQFENVNRRLVADQLLERDYVIVQNEGLFGLYLLSGEQLLPIEYEKIEVDPVNGKKLILTTKDKSTTYKLK